MAIVPHMIVTFASSLAVLVLGSLSAPAALAHEIRPAIATVTLEPSGRFLVTVSANLEALLAGIGPQHTDTDQAPGASVYNELRRLPPEELRARFMAFSPRWLAGVRLEFDGRRARPAIEAVDVPPIRDVALARVSEIRLSGEVPDGAGALRWGYAAEFGSSVLRIKRPGDSEPVTSWLKDGAPSEPVALSGGPSKGGVQLFVEFLALGFTHILPKGLDHILFVLGLYLLSTEWRPLLVQVTAFTVAHSITLALGLYGLVQLSPRIVEPLIAASIVYVAVENMLTSRLQTWRPAVVFGFGLLHGLGFAGVLHELDLARRDYATALVAFNIGVELAQLAVIALAFLATGLWFRERPWYRSRIVWPSSAAIAAIGLYWSIERLVLGP
jgi:hydrogenase/urease accessory protein HupE